MTQRCKEIDPILLEQIGSDKGRSKPTQAEEQIYQVQRGGTMLAAHAVGQGICPGHDNAATHPQQKHQ